MSPGGGGSSPEPPDPGLARGPLIRQTLESSGWSEVSLDVLQAALRPQSRKVYERYWVNSLPSFLRKARIHEGFLLAWWWSLFVIWPIAGC